jgi:CRP/FNR family transcriptional regulator, cyclic AMP receptor protein
MKVIPRRNPTSFRRDKVEIRRNGRLLDTLSEKSIFGQMALIDHAPRAATAVAATDVVLVPVAEKQSWA